MPVVDTTTAFTNNEQVTSTKLNNIMDNSFFVSGAVVTSGGLEVTTGGQMQVATNGIITTRIADSNVTTAKIADSNVTTAKIADANITQAKLSTNVVGNGPAFRASASGTTIISGATLINLATENFDTNNNFSGNRFTPTVAGYYLIAGAIEISGGGQNVQVSIYKNNVKAASGIQVSGLAYNSVCSDIIYMNGTTDYVELFGVSSPGSTVAASGTGTYMSGCLIRSA